MVEVNLSFVFVNVVVWSLTKDGVVGDAPMVNKSTFRQEMQKRLVVTIEDLAQDPTQLMTLIIY